MNLVRALSDCLEADLVEHALHHRRKPPRADIFDARIDLDRHIGDGVYRILGELKLNALRRHEAQYIA